ncbi:retrovirus-related pol polyprotein from transposon TNT 1-94 [Tanacetum coccineum]
MNEDKIKKDLEEIETINIELDHRVSKLIAENKHLKQTYKQLYDSIKPTRIRSKEQCDDLINQVNLKSVEISDLNASLQEKVLVITYLKDDLRKLKGKSLVDNDVTKHPSDPEMLKIDVEPITSKLLNKKTAHSAYIKHTQEEATVLRDLVEHVKSKYPLDHSLEYACRYAKLIQELLTHISKTCPSVNNTDGKLVAVTPKNKDKRVRFTKPVTSSGYTITKTASTSNLVSNKPMSSSTGVKPSTSACRSHPSGNTKKDKNRQTPRTAYIEHSKLNANYELKCVKCNGCMLSDNHDLCVLDFINNVNARNKSKSVKQSSKRKVWKPTGKVFTNIRYIWRPTGRTFTIVGNACPLTRITTTTEVPLRKSTALENETPKPVVTLVYSRKPRKSKTNVPVSKSKVLKSVSANKKEPSQSWGSIVSDVPSSSLDDCSHPNCSLKVVISHETFVARSPQQNGVVERRNHTLIEAAQTMLIYVKAPLFLWAEAVATACYTQNCSIVRLRHGKTPYEILHDNPPNLSFFYVFGALCYLANDSENLGKLQPKVDIDFDKLTAMASEHSSLRPALHEMTSATISSGLVTNPPPSTPFIPPSRTPEVIALTADVVAPEPVASTGSPSSTIVDQDAPSPIAHMGNDPYFGIPIPEVPSDQSSSTYISHTMVHPDHQISEHNSKWTKDHPLENIIGELDRPVSTRL